VALTAKAETGQSFARSEVGRSQLPHVHGGHLFVDREPIAAADSAGASGFDAAKLARCSSDRRDPLDGLDGRAHLLSGLGRALRLPPISLRLVGPDAGELRPRWSSSMRCSGSGRTRTANSAGESARGAAAATCSLTCCAALDRIGRAASRSTAPTWRRVWLPALFPSLQTAATSSPLGALPKLSQWLVYSLEEAIAPAGLDVDGHDAPDPVCADYCNGGSSSTPRRAEPN